MVPLVKSEIFNTIPFFVCVYVSIFNLLFTYINFTIFWIMCILFGSCVHHVYPCVSCLDHVYIMCIHVYLVWIMCTSCVSMCILFGSCVHHVYPCVSCLDHVYIMCIHVYLVWIMCNIMCIHVYLVWIMCTQCEFIHVHQNFDTQVKNWDTYIHTIEPPILHAVCIQTWRSKLPHRSGSG